MVLQSNHARRPSNTENVLPNPHRRFSRSTRASSHRSSLQSAGQRRRARANGLSTPRYAAEQANRRNKYFRTESTVTDATVPMDDTEMGDAKVADSVAVPKTPITLPRYLFRPIRREVAKETIVAVDPEFEDVPLPYIRERLETMGPAMLGVLSSVEATPVRNSLPKELPIIVNDFSSDLPTHMLAVYSRQSSASPNSTRRVTLFPIHNIIVALHCAHLPTLPKSTASEPDSVGQMTLPLIPLCIPSPETFSQLSAYLYTRNCSQLLASLLPTRMLTPASILSLDHALDVNSPELKQYSKELHATYTPHALLMHAMTVNGLWRNACALGVFDDQLWEVLDLAWDAILGALGRTEGTAEMTS